MFLFCGSFDYTFQDLSAELSFVDFSKPKISTVCVLYFVLVPFIFRPRVDMTSCSTRISRCVFDLMFLPQRMQRFFLERGGRGQGWVSGGVLIFRNWGRIFV